MPRKKKVVEGPLAVLDGELVWEGFNPMPKPGLLKFRIEGADDFLYRHLHLNASILPTGLSYVDIRGTIHVEIIRRSQEERVAILRKRGANEDYLAEISGEVEHGEHSKLR